MFCLIARRAVLAAAVAATTACTIHDTQTPPLTGPSGPALLLRITASPDSISQDGGSQSSVKVTATGPDGRPVTALPVRMDMLVGGVPQDFGTLSARTIVTGSDGTASVVFTAPPSPSDGVFGTCNALPGTCVTIVATPTGANFDFSKPETTIIRLVPPGVILPPAPTPTAQFTFSPTPVNFNIPAIFDASTSCGGAIVGGLCSNSNAITSYAWNFGDGASATGKTATHTYVGSTTPATSFNVVLTVTNDRGVSASATQVISVSGSALATGDWVFSPLLINVNDQILFNAEGIRPPAGHVLTQYNWNFGDGTTGSGQVTTHAYATTNTFAVVLTVTDDSGQRTAFSAKNVPVGTGAPIASFTSSVTNAATHTMAFDGSGSTGTGGATIVLYQWAFGDGNSFGPSSTATASHSYLNAGTYTVRLTVTDNQGRTGSTSTSVSVP